jgi:hypothetical protein
LGDLLRAVQENTSLERDDRTLDASVNARWLGCFSVNAGWSQTHQDVEFNGEGAEELVDQPGEEFTRTVNTYGAGVTWSSMGWTVGADYRRDDGNRPILRTDFSDRDRYKFRASYAWKDLVRVGGTWRESRADNNDIPEIAYETRVREVAGDLEVGPIGKILTLRFSAGEFRVDRDILIRVPQDFTIVPQAQNEIGHTWEGGLHVAWKKLALDGSFPLDGQPGLDSVHGQPCSRSGGVRRRPQRRRRRGMAPGPVRRGPGIRPGGVARRLQRQPIRHFRSLETLIPVRSRSTRTGGRSMKSKSTRLGLTAALLFWGDGLRSRALRRPTWRIQKQAKAAGVAVKDCTGCHVDKLPKKDATS